MKVEENQLKKDVKHDKFCWRCCGEGTTLKCSACVRSFHTNCSPAITENGDDDTKWLCSVCINLKHAASTSKKSDLMMLPVLIDKTLQDKSFNLLKFPLAGASYTESYVAESIVNPIDLTKIKKNIASYTSFEHLLSDVQWIVHNCFILFLDNHEKMEIAKSLVDYLEEEIENIKKCSECYANRVQYPNDWFTMACKELHLIVWAKNSGFCYWPAKLMSIDGQLIGVRFFGDHKHSDVPATNCFLYSETNPNRSRNTTVLYKSALKEAEVYMKNIRKVFGSYNQIETKTAFNPALLDKYIVQVIPELANSDMVKSIRSKIDGQKSIEKPENNIKCERPICNSVPMNLDMIPLSPKRNVLIAITRNDDKSKNTKRSSKEMNHNEKPKIFEKKVKLNSEPANENSQNSTLKMNGQMNTTLNGNMLPRVVLNPLPVETKSLKVENVIIPSANVEKMKESTDELLNSTEIESNDENVKMEMNDLSCISQPSINEPSSRAFFVENDLEFNQDIGDTLKIATSQMCTVIESKLKLKFDTLKRKLQAVTFERDQLTLKTENDKHEMKTNHAKAIADLNEKYAQVIAKAKKDAEKNWMAEQEKRNVKAEHDLNEANQIFAQKLTEAEKKLKDFNATLEKVKEEHNQILEETKKQFNIEMNREKEQMAIEIENLKKTHNETVAQLENKIQKIIRDKSMQKTQIENKYRDIVAGIKQKAEVERKEIRTCACCGKELEAKRVCSTECEQMLGIWQN